MKSAFSRWFGVWMVLAALALAGCSDDGGGQNPPADAGSDAADAGADATDVTEDAADTADADADAADAADAVDIGFLCQSCTSDDQCGATGDRCLQLPAGDSGCARSCDPDAQAPCASGFSCLAVDSAETDFQCVPNRLTCADRCSDVSCSGGQVCDPWTGDCVEPLGICDTDCTTAETCGNGPEDLCVGMPGTSGERACLTGCNPQAEVSECPINYFCTPLTQEEGTTEGICFPLSGTCIDRCSGVDCAAGENCNQLTGQCEASQYGYCEKGCTSDAQCGGQNDVCLAIGIGDGAHCWQDCSDDPDVCSDNYDCVTLQGSTQSICVPTGRSCDMCYGTSCYPGGVCDPTSGDCVELQQDCTQTGCPSGELCDPVSTQCVAVGRPCSGDSWAADCDNVVTSCTTRRAGTEGTCQKKCVSDSDCSGDESCVETNLQKLCLPDDLNGPQTCGTLNDTTSAVGTPCGSGLRSCPSSADICVQAGNLDGFCSIPCTSDADCGAAGRCGVGPDGDDVCIPAQCECAATPRMSGAISSAWTTALGAIDVSQCDLWLDPAIAAAMTELSNTPLALASVTDVVALPLRAVEMLESALAELDASTSLSAAIAAGAKVRGATVTPSAGNYTYSGSDSKLTQAVAALITQAGGTPDTAQLETQAQDVPAGFQDIAAPIISAAADALAARQAALQQAGWDAATQSAAFDGAPYLLLPGTSAQLANRPDLNDSTTAATYAAFPLGDLAQAAADLSATIEQATASTGAASGWTGFSYVVDTPAGKVVLGDAGDTVYDPASNSALAGDIAIIIDAGGNDTYKLPVAANQSVANGVAVAVDLAGQDTYTYETAADPNDTASLLPSDTDGRKTPAGPLNQNDGPVSLSTTPRQGGARLGIALLVDQGGQDDTYRSLRMSQGAAVFGVGALFDDGGADSYQAEALAQGAAIDGLALLWDVAGDDDYRVWHAGQGFGTAGGVGVLADVDGTDTYEAVTGQAGGEAVLYLSLADRARSNRNLAQGAGAGIAATSSAPGLAGGIGILRDRAGVDSYTAGTFAQGFGSVRGLGLLADAAGDDVYSGRGLVQGVGELNGGGAFLEEGGADQYNQSDFVVQNGQGTGRSLGWGFFQDMGGDDTVSYTTPGGGIGLDGGFGFAFFADGADSHSSTAQASWGYADNRAPQGSALDGALTVGVFLDASSTDDTYTRPNLDTSAIGDAKVWQQPDPATDAVRGVGVDE